MSKIPTCPECSGVMKETSRYWFVCTKCGHQCDGEEVEWREDSLIDPNDPKTPACPDCGGSMNEKSDRWFKCNVCNAEYDGELVEWKHGKPGTTFAIVKCPKCQNPCAYNEKGQRIICPKDGIIQL